MLLVGVGVGACEGGDAALVDAGRVDASTRDAGAPDDAAPDDTAPDGAAPDSAAPDSAAPDGAAPDAGPLDCAEATVEQPFRIASGFVPMNFEVAGEEVYFTTPGDFGSSGGRVARVSRGGGPVQDLASGEYEPRHLVVGAEEVYFTTRNIGATVKSVPRNGGPVNVVLDHYQSPQSLASDGENLYVSTTYPDDQIVAVSLADGSDRVLAGGESFWMPSHLLVDDVFVYFINEPGLWGGRIERVRKSGGPVEIVALHQPNMRDLLRAGDTLYWVNEGNDSFSELDGELRAALTTGAAPQPLARLDGNVRFFFDGDRTLVTYGSFFGWIAELDPAGAVSPIVSQFGKLIRAVVADETDYYFIDPGMDIPADGGFPPVEIPGGLYRVPRDGSIAPELLVGEQSYPVALVGDAENVYWANTGTPPGYSDGEIVRYTKATGETLVLADGQARPRELVLHDGTLYWTNSYDGTVVALDTAGGGPTTISDDGIRPTGLAVATNGDVYWGDEEYEEIRGLESGIAVTLASGVYPLRIAVDGSSVYFSSWGPGFDSDWVGSVPRGGGPTRVLAENLGWLGGFALRDGRLYFHDFDTDTLFTTPVTGAVPELRASELDQPSSLTSDGESIYFSAAHTIWKVPLGGGEPTEVVPDTGIWVGNVRVDEDTIYWVGRWAGVAAIFCAPK